MYNIYGRVEDDNREDLDFKLFNEKDYQSLIRGNTFFYLRRPAGKLKPINGDEQSMKKLYRRFSIVKQWIVSMQIYLNWLKQSTINVIKEPERECSALCQDTKIPP